MSETQDRRTRSTALQANSRALITRAVAALKRSRWRLMSSHEVLVGQRPRISGGAPELDEATVHQQVRELLDNGVLPTSPASEIGRRRRAAPDDCTVCGVSIVAGEMQAEIPPPDGTVVVVHRRCFDLWTQAAAQRNGRP